MAPTGHPKSSPTGSCASAAFGDQSLVSQTGAKAPFSYCLPTTEGHWVPEARRAARLRVEVRGDADDTVRQHQNFLRRRAPGGGGSPCPRWRSATRMRS
ncbi:hypothetical protein ACP4OV_017311 [Aristida adscensionis]